MLDLEVDGQSQGVHRVDVLVGSACGDVPAQRVRGAVSNGCYALPAPLPAGSHTLDIHGEPAGGFVVDVTYSLTVG